MISVQWRFLVFREEHIQVLPSLIEKPLVFDDPSISLKLIGALRRVDLQFNWNHDFLGGQHD